MLEASTDNLSISLSVNSHRQPVLQGDAGYSTKNQNGTIASYYYSVPDLKTEGEIEINGTHYKVAGDTWMDHEWSSTVLGENQSGWDWFALHFDDGTKLMMFQVRGRKGNTYQSAVLVLSDGSIKKFDTEYLSIKPLEFWNSAATRNRYPVEWELGIDSEVSQLQIVVKPAVRDQELNLGFTYYEGVVHFSGSLNGKGVSGVGYMELVGYDQ
jgi:predicted secreted hydrolase